MNGERFSLCANLSWIASVVMLWLLTNKQAKLDLLVFPEVDHVGAVLFGIPSVIFILFIANWSWFWHARSVTDCTRLSNYLPPVLPFWNPNSSFERVCGALLSILFPMFVLAVALNRMHEFSLTNRCTNEVLQGWSLYAPTWDWHQTERWRWNCTEGYSGVPLVQPGVYSLGVFLTVSFFFVNLWYSWHAFRSQGRRVREGMAGAEVE